MVKIVKNGGFHYVDYICKFYVFFVCICNDRFEWNSNAMLRLFDDSGMRWSGDDHFKIFKIPGL